MPIPDDWSQVASTGKLYKIHAESFSFLDARQTCLDQGMDLYNMENGNERSEITGHRELSLQVSLN